MSNQPCSVCGGLFPEDQLLFGEAGKVCVECESEQSTDDTMRRQLWLAALAPVASPIVAAGSLCLPFVGAFLAPFIAASGVRAAYMAFLLYQNAEEGDGKTSVAQKVCLLLGAILGGLGSLGMFLFTCLVLLQQVLLFFGFGSSGY